jgi:hypothetical protein
VVGGLVIRTSFGSPSQPLFGATIEALAPSGRVVQRVHTAPDGSFSLALERGFYTVELLPVTGGRGPSEQVVVGVGRYAPAHDRRVHLVLVWPQGL